MPSISVKELREKLPLVRSELKKGTTFLIIYQSKPIAKLTPVDDIPEGAEATDTDWEKSALDAWDDEVLSKEELKYYLSLKPLK
jgi:antitoxin (DNA-binding transcriptional repressor) of toxin-antitoxin stability system